MIVVDATVLADFLAGDEKLKRAAEALMLEDSSWVSVGLWRYELGNVFWKKLRYGGGDGRALRRSLMEAESFLLETVDEVDCGKVWEIATALGLTFYDASYVWLARSRGLELRTRDKQILRECPDVVRAMPEP